MSSPQLLTPDFYDYTWHPLASATIDGDFVRLTWPDGLEFGAHGWWLRENIVAVGATDPTTREATLDPADLPADLTLVRATVTEHGALELTWNSAAFTGTVHPGWLHHVARGGHLAASYLPSRQPWTATTMAAPPTLSGPDVLQHDDALETWLEHLVRYGIGRLRGLPTDLDTVAAVADRIGPQRDTNFGVVWSVKAEIRRNDENTSANTELRLGPHTDLPTRELPPGFQFLHCLVNTCGGGWSRMTDGEALVAHLEASEPDTYEALTTLRWVFFNRSREHDHRWSGPMIDRAGTDSPLTIRAFYPVRAFPDMAESDISRAYQATRRFHELAADTEFQIGYPFEPGDLVGFDNRRILHGRDAFDASEGHRHLRGCYVDQDEIYSRLRVLARHREQAVTRGPAT